MPDNPVDPDEAALDADLEEAALDDALQLANAQPRVEADPDAALEDARKRAAAAPSVRPEHDAVSSLGYGYANTATSGAGDEISGTLAALIPNAGELDARRYRSRNLPSDPATAIVPLDTRINDSIGAIREDTRHAQEDNPAAFGAGQVGGALTLGTAIPGSTAASVGGRAAVSAAQGAGQLAAQQAGDAEGGIGDRMIAVGEHVADNPEYYALAGGLPAAASGVSDVIRAGTNAARSKAYRHRGAAPMPPYERVRLEQNRGPDAVEKLGKRIEEAGLHKTPWYNPFPATAERMNKNARAYKEEGAVDLAATEPTIRASGITANTQNIVDGLRKGANTVRKMWDKPAGKVEGRLRDEFAEGIETNSAVRVHGPPKPDRTAHDAWKEEGRIADEELLEAQKAYDASVQTAKAPPNQQKLGPMQQKGHEEQAAWDMQREAYEDAQRTAANPPMTKFEGPMPLTGHAEQEAWDQSQAAYEGAQRTAANPPMTKFEGPMPMVGHAEQDAWDEAYRTQNLNPDPKDWAEYLLRAQNEPNLAPPLPIQGRGAPASVAEHYKAKQITENPRPQLYEQPRPDVKIPAADMRAQQQARATLEAGPPAGPRPELYEQPRPDVKVPTADIRAQRQARRTLAAGPPGPRPELYSKPMGHARAPQSEWNAYNEAQEAIKQPRPMTPRDVGPEPEIPLTEPMQFTGEAPIAEFIDNKRYYYGQKVHLPVGGIENAGMKDLIRDQITTQMLKNQEQALTDGVANGQISPEVYAQWKKGNEKWGLGSQIADPSLIQMSKESGGERSLADMAGVASMVMQGPTLRSNAKAAGWHTLARSGEELSGLINKPSRGLGSAISAAFDTSRLQAPKSDLPPAEPEAKEANTTLKEVLTAPGRGWNWIAQTLSGEKDE